MIQLFLVRIFLKFMPSYLTIAALLAGVFLVGATAIFLSQSFPQWQRCLGAAGALTVWVGISSRDPNFRRGVDQLLRRLGFKFFLRS